MTVLLVTVGFILGILIGGAIGYGVIGERWHSLEKKKQNDLALIEATKAREWEAIRKAQAEVSQKAATAQQEAMKAAEAWSVGIQQKLDAERREFEAAKRLLPELQETISSLELQRSRLRDDVESLTGEMGRIKGELQAKQQVYKTAEQSLREAQVFESHRSEIKGKIDKLNDELSNVQLQHGNKVASLQGELAEWQEKIDSAHKVYKYRKTLPDSHEKLQARFEELKAKNEQLSADLKEAKAAGKNAAMNSKDREKLVAQFDKLGRSYVEDTFKFVMSKMTTNNFTASRDRVLKTISSCRAIGYDWPEDMEEEYTEKVREEFKRVLRIEEMRLEQQRIREQIREEQRALREIEALKKKEEQAIKERQEAEKTREAMRLAIEDALLKANGEHTAQILEMEKALAEKDQEIVAKQQEIDDNQRAISNAQITKAGHVYVLSNVGSFGEGVFKIGMTRRNDPQERVDELGGAAVPFPFDVHLMVGCDNAPELEKALHRRFNGFRVNRVNLRKEYFRVAVDEVQQEIEQFVGKAVDYRANPHILEEYAEQYRESLQTTLADIEEVEELYKEAGVSEEGDEE